MLYQVKSLYYYNRSTSFVQHCLTNKKPKRLTEYHNDPQIALIVVVTVFICNLTYKVYCAFLPGTSLYQKAASTCSLPSSACHKLQLYFITNSTDVDSISCSKQPPGKLSSRTYLQMCNKSSHGCDSVLTIERVLMSNLTQQFSKYVTKQG